MYPVRLFSAYALFLFTVYLDATTETLDNFGKTTRESRTSLENRNNEEDFANPEDYTQTIKQKRNKEEMRSGKTCADSKAGQVVNTNNILSCRRKESILAIHNRFRDEISSGIVGNFASASNMIQLRWDEELAEKAKTYTDQCIYLPEEAYKNNYRLRVKNRTVGAITGLWEGVDMTFFNDHISLELVKLFMYWLTEAATIESGGTKTWGLSVNNTNMYPQLLWGPTLYVGCSQGAFFKNAYHSIFICLYYPTADEKKIELYATGKKNCTGHGLFDSHSYRHLCAIDDQLYALCPIDHSVEELKARAAATQIHGWFKKESAILKILVILIYLIFAKLVQVF